VNVPVTILSVFLVLDLIRENLSNREGQTDSSWSVQVDGPIITNKEGQYREPLSRPQKNLFLVVRPLRGGGGLTGH